MKGSATATTGPTCPLYWIPVTGGDTDRQRLPKLRNGLETSIYGKLRREFILFVVLNCSAFLYRCKTRTKRLNV